MHFQGQRPCGGSSKNDPSLLVTVSQSPFIWAETLANPILSKIETMVKWKNLLVLMVVVSSLSPGQGLFTQWRTTIRISRSPVPSTCKTKESTRYIIIQYICAIRGRSFTLNTWSDLEQHLCLINSSKHRAEKRRLSPSFG